MNNDWGNPSIPVDARALKPGDELLFRDGRGVHAGRFEALVTSGVMIGADRGGGVYKAKRVFFSNVVRPLLVQSDLPEPTYYRCIVCHQKAVQCKHMHPPIARQGVVCLTCGAISEQEILWRL